MADASTVPSWFMRGSLIGECNCAWGCPCNFDAPPTYGHCDGFYTRVVKEGRFGDVPLDGVAFVSGGHSPGPVHEGNLTDVLIIDEGTTEGQRSAIERLWRGNGVGPPFDIFASVPSTWIGPIVAPIEVRLASMNSIVRIAGGEVYDLAMSRIKNPVTGEEEEIYLDKPTGITSLRSEMGMSLRARFSAGGLDIEHGGRYAEYAEFDHSGP